MYNEWISLATRWLMQKNDLPVIDWSSKPFIKRFSRWMSTKNNNVCGHGMRTWMTVGHGTASLR
jgi:hypothetical protein